MDKMNFKDVSKDYYYIIKSYGDNLFTVGINNNVHNDFPYYYTAIVPSEFINGYKSALEDFINNITEKTGVKELKIFRTNERLISFSDSNFLKRKNITDREKFFAIHFFNSYAAKVDRKLLEKVIYNYDVFMDQADFSLNEMIEHAYKINQAYYNINSYPFAQRFSVYAHIKKHQDTNYYYYYNLIYCLLNDSTVPGDILVKDYHVKNNIAHLLSLNEDNYTIHHISKLPLYLPNFLDKMLNLRKDQIELIFGEFSTIVKDDDSAVRVFDQVYNNQKLTLSDTIDTYNNIVQHFKDVVDVRTMLYLHERLLDKNTIVLNGFLNELLKDFKTHNMYSKNNYDNIVSYFIGNRVVSWIRPRGYMEDVLILLLEIMSPLEIYHMITCFGSDVERMTLPEWREFIRQYDDFKDFSPAWWRTMITEKKL